MRVRRWGRIVNMSSIGGIYPNPKLLISHVLSAAINNFTKSLALEVASDGILVNAIGIGAIATENWAANMIPALRRTRPDVDDLSDEQILVKVGAERTPIGRVGDPPEIARLPCFWPHHRRHHRSFRRRGSLYVTTLPSAKAEGHHGGWSNRAL